MDFLHPGSGKIAQETFHSLKGGFPVKTLALSCPVYASIAPWRGTHTKFKLCSSSWEWWSEPVSLPDQALRPSGTCPQCYSAQHCTKPFKRRKLNSPAGAGSVSVGG